MTENDCKKFIGKRVDITYKNHPDAGSGLVVAVKDGYIIFDWGYAQKITSDIVVEIIGNVRS
jgi:hypothetical protein